MNKIGFLEEAPGEKSMSRLMVAVIMANSLLTSNAVLIVGLIKYLQGGESDFIGVVLTAGGLITTGSAVAMGWKYSSKSQEIKSL